MSKVKYAILKHLPVFLQKTSTGESDSQLTNSVYFDNDQLGECVYCYERFIGLAILRYVSNISLTFSLYITSIL